MEFHVFSVFVDVPVVPTVWSILQFLKFLEVLVASMDVAKCSYVFPFTVRSWKSNIAHGIDLTFTATAKDMVVKNGSWFEPRDIIFSSLFRANSYIPPALKALHFLGETFTKCITILKVNWAMEKKGPWLFRGFVGDDILPSYTGRIS